MLVEFTRHSDTSMGRCKIGSIVDLPQEEAKSLFEQKKCNLLESIVEQEVEEDGSRNDE